ncbi:hypothetical protein A3D84_01990 [Candidatus Woesebacteria bacterium RIFCSPHIGHO2_02_FULL_42_20]|uniref:Uncharacterized protein n=1 Tax=Candidatus Woesebacteria bacterium RIFCSPHIGHO2_12_FULL_41_24 TaxID=1802510 RepID=A0A1F8ASV2_9BACT|nr:MAG: hypothetical protein A2W15_04275 [Candidatus Woesebacteria bacterium RBG_16_41_13]OGM30019.1 MAG: hypothetical protein A2873_04825 [Candidatus Woesebacteria bacterium RIFCSPHIGHO2_01_FULL_42_80]OGM35097.1 MAG: hypothetical protein A3D84_01990 [Candidatus Woesebacteria bacterium RIFCSPHIGHO2_02_FULL_42_20]OGM54833.1 MAG: hypothetical protein A3E44_01590 [Candidatus Woesebacteria bacterium RIFCSPHIGHO2_12_FULL_41_24]OGM67449.1 MAG: hypothetical protein A2969_05440 [Candidatus Woesebacteri
MATITSHNVNAANPIRPDQIATSKNRLWLRSTISSCKGKLTRANISPKTTSFVSAPKPNKGLSLIVLKASDQIVNLLSNAETFFSRYAPRIDISTNPTPARETRYLLRIKLVKVTIANIAKPDLEPVTMIAMRIIGSKTIL